MSNRIKEYMKRCKSVADTLANVQKIPILPVEAAHATGTIDNSLRAFTSRSTSEMLEVFESPTEA